MKSPPVHELQSCVGNGDEHLFMGFRKVGCDFPGSGALDQVDRHITIFVMADRGC